MTICSKIHYLLFAWHCIVCGMSDCDRDSAVALALLEKQTLLIVYNIWDGLRPLFEIKQVESLTAAWAGMSRAATGSFRMLQLRKTVLLQSESLIWPRLQGPFKYVLNEHKSLLFVEKTGEQKHCRIVMFFLLLYWSRIDYLTKESKLVAAVLISATSNLN